MFTHDPYQSYSAYSPYIGATQFGQPYLGQQHQGLNPLAHNPMAGVYGGIHPLQIQAALAAQAAAIQQLQNPLAQLYQNPLLLAGITHQQGIGYQNPLLLAGVQNPLQNPLLQNLLLQNPMLQNPLNPLLAQGGYGQISPFQQSPFQQSPFQQSLFQQSPFQSPFQQMGQLGQLQPQSWVGQGYGGINPLLQQFGQRGGQGAGLGPWGVS